MTTPATVYELTGPGDLVTRQESLDTDNLGPNEVAARTLVTAVSPGTEVAAFIGLPPLRPMQVYPRVVGYCNIAEVIEVGPAIVDLQPGARIASFQSHRSAFICDRAEATALPPTADITSCSVAYLFHLGYAAALRTKLVAGQDIAVVGLGAVGLATVAVAAMAGARVTAVSARDWPPAIEMGAHRMIGPTETTAAFDTVFTTSNRWSDWQLALSLARHGGTIASLGFPGRGEPPPEYNPVDSRWLYDKQLAILGCGSVAEPAGSSTGDWFDIGKTFPFVLSRVLDRALPARRLISEVVSADNLATVYRRLAARERGLITCALEWT